MKARIRSRSKEGVEAGAFPLPSQARQNTCDFTDPVSGGSEANALFGKAL